MPAASVSAATEYTFTVSSEGAYPSASTGRIVVDGQRWRIDLDGDAASVRGHDSVLQTASGRRIALNHANRTWYEFSAPAAVHVHSLFEFHRSHPTHAFDLALERLPVTNGTAEEAVFRYKTRFEIGGETVGGAVWGRLVRITRPDAAHRPPMSLLYSVVTGTKAVDDMLNAQISGRSDPIWQVELTINRQFDGAAPMTQTIRWTVTGVRTIATESSKFDVPAGYANQAPQIGSPG
jgi:hypothetical protein